MRDVSDQRARNTILIVDDSSDCRASVREVVEPLGHDVLEADDGEAALELCRRAKPALVLLDAAMPVMTGEEFVAIKRQDPRIAGIPVVMITGSRVGVPAGVQMVLQKPLSYEALLEAIHRSLGSSEAEP